MSSAVDDDDDAVDDDDTRARLKGDTTNALAASVSRRKARALHAIFMVSLVALLIVAVNGTEARLDCAVES